MSSYNMTVEDSSPLISYSPAGAWADTPSNDPLSSLYQGTSYHTTSAKGATATISFNGTGVSIFGGMRSNYGTYIILVDGQTIASGSAQGGNVTRQLLGTVSGLPYGSHVAVLTNAGGAPIDIDWVDFEAQVGESSNGPVKVAEIDDTDPSIVYSPASAWEVNTNPSFSNSTLSFSQDPNASASLQFSGGAIAIYGTVSPDHANIVITVDGQSQNLRGGGNGFASSVHPQTLLYYQSDLSVNTPHVLQFSSNSRRAGGPFIDLDMIAIYTNDLSTGSTPSTISAQQPLISGTSVAEKNLPTSSSTSVPSTGQSSTSRHSTGAIVGGVLGAIAFLIALGVVALMVLRRRRNIPSSRIEKSMISVSPILPMQGEPKTPILPLQGDPDVEANAGRSGIAFPFPVAPKKAYSNRHSIAPSYYSDPTIESHSRDGSVFSVQSSTPLVPSLPRGVPRINTPQPRSGSSRKPVPRSSGLEYYNTPARPNNRPPTLDFTQMESPR